MSRLKNINDAYTRESELDLSRKRLIKSMTENAEANPDGETPHDVLKATRFMLSDYIDALVEVGDEVLYERKNLESKLSKSREFLEFGLTTQGSDMTVDITSSIRDYIENLMEVNDPKFAKKIATKRVIEQILRGDNELNVNGLIVKNISDKKRQLILAEALRIYLLGEKRL